MGDKTRNFTFQLVLQHDVAKQLARFCCLFAWLFTKSELFFALQNGLLNWREKNSNAAFFIHMTWSRSWALYDGQGIADLTKLGVKNFKQSFLSLCDEMLLKKEATREFQRFVYEESQRKSECWSWNRKILPTGRIVSRNSLSSQFYREFAWIPSCNTIETDKEISWILGSPKVVSSDLYACKGPWF